MGCSCPSKVFLAGLSLLFWLMSAALIIIGIWVFISYENVENLAKSTHILAPAGVIVGVGIFLFLLGIVGCIGAFKEQKCLLGFYFILLLLIFLGMCCAGILAYVHKDDLGESVHDDLARALNQYGNDSTITEEVDYMQQHLECCGVDNYTDWYNTTFYNKTHGKKPYPDSCCVDKNCTYTKPPANDTSLYHDGCHVKLRDNFKSHLGIIAGVAVAFVVIQLLGMICSCVLICRRKNDVPYIGLGDPQGMRV